MQITVLTPGPVPPEATELTVPMRDGVLLAADLYPAGPAPHPVLLVRLPYDKDGPYCAMPTTARYAVARGYTVVVQDVRGKFRSGGATEFGLHEVDDGFDTLDWIAEQPWCDGRVVMWGDSYYGLTQLAAVASGHPALRAVAPRLTGTRLSREVVHPGGDRDVEATARKAYLSSWFVDRCSYDWEIDWTARPLRSTLDDFFAASGRRSAGYDAELGDRPGQGPVHEGPPVQALLAAPPVPVLFTVGLHDNCALYSWHDLRALLGDPAWAPSVWLRLEAVDHENNHLHLPPAEPGADPDLDRVLAPALDFFDDVLAGGSATPRVHHDVGHGEPGQSATWPPDGAVPWVLALGADGLREEAGAPGEVSWEHDPADPVPSTAPDPFARLVAHPDLAAVAVRDDVVHLEGDPVPEPVDLLGPARADVVLGTTAVGTALHVRLVDVAPDGSHELVAKSQVHLPDLPAARTVAVDLLSLSHRLRTGHRIALQLMSSDFPDYVLEPGDGTDPWESTSHRRSTQTVQVGGTTDSCLHLTVRRP